MLVLSLKLDPLLGGNIPQTYAATLFFKFFSKVIGNGGVLIGVAVLLYISGIGLRDQGLKLAGRTGFLSVAISGAVVQFFKAAFERPRPGVGFSIVKLLQHPSLLDASSKLNSFPSGHTTVSFAMAYVLSKSYPSLRVFFYAMAALVAASRVYLGAHYPSDVAGGAILGLSAGWLIMNNVRIKERWKIGGLTLLIVFIAFFKLGGFILFDIDEAVFSEASREMVVTGDYITPHYNLEPRYDKPILFYWFMSTAFKLFGTNEFAARFTSAGFGVLLVLMTFFFVRRVKGNAAAYLSAIALLLNLEFFVYSHSAVTDMTLTFFIAASVYSFYLGVREDNPKWFAVFWGAAALATLTKGVIGILFPVTIAFLFLFAVKDLGRMKSILRPSRILLYLLIAAPWFAAQSYINGWDFFNAFIIKHHIKRFAEVNSLHGGPFYYYLFVLLIGFFPWVAMLPAALYRGFKKRLTAEEELYLLTGVWFIFILVFFSVSRTKLPNYIFPLFPAASIMSGLIASELIIGKGKKAGLRHALYILLILSSVIGVALCALPFMHVKMAIPFPPVFFFTLGGIFLLAAVFSIIAFYAPALSFAGISAVMVILVIFLRLYALPPVNLSLQKTLYDYATYARSLGKDDVLVTYEIDNPSVAFYAQRKTLKTVKSAAYDIRENLNHNKVLVITRNSRYEDLKEFKDLKVIDAEGEYMLLGNFNDAGTYPDKRP